MANSLRFIPYNTGNMLLKWLSLTRDIGPLMARQLTQNTDIARAYYGYQLTVNYMEQISNSHN